MDYFGKVGRILEEWAVRMRGTRGRIIADITSKSIKDLSKNFSLPEGFTNYIDDYRAREGALQSIADYRDHFIHPFHVFSLGYYILDQWRRKCPQQSNFIENDENLALKIWFATSIYHDVGYPSEKLETLVKDFFKTSVGREIESQFNWGSVLLANENIEHIDKLSKCFAKKVPYSYSTIKIKNNIHILSDECINDLGVEGKDLEYLEKKVSGKRLFKKWLHKRLIEDHDHGVLTALMLLNQNKIGWKNNEEWNIAYEAALAIILHSWRRNSNNPNNLPEFDLGPLPVEEFFLAFFLSYCDTAQEWGRRVLLELMKEDTIQVTTPSTSRLESTLDDLKMDCEKTIVTIKYLSKKKGRVNGGKNLEEIFNDAKQKFKSTWFRKKTTPRLMIEGKAKDGSMRYVEASDTRPECSV